MKKRLDWTKSDIDNYIIRHDLAFEVGYGMNLYLCVVTIGATVHYEVVSHNKVVISTTDFDEAVKIYNEYK